MSKYDILRTVAALPREEREKAVSMATLEALLDIKELMQKLVSERGREYYIDLSGVTQEATQGESSQQEIDFDIDVPELEYKPKKK